MLTPVNRPFENCTSASVAQLAQFVIAVAQEAETGKNVGVTVLGKNGLSFHIEFLYLDAVLLKVEKEMWKSTDFDSDFSDFTDSVDFQKKIDVSPLDPHCGMKTDCQFY